MGKKRYEDHRHEKQALWMDMGPMHFYTLKNKKEPSADRREENESRTHSSTDYSSLFSVDSFMVVNSEKLRADILRRRRRYNEKIMQH